MYFNDCFLLSNFINFSVPLHLPWAHIFFSNIALKTSNLWSFYEEGNKYCSKTIFYLIPQFLSVT